MALAVCFATALLLASCDRGEPPATVTPAASESKIVREGSPTAQSGEALYQANCQRCHGGATGGSMMDMPPRHNANGHTWHHADQQLIDTVLNGSGQMGEMMRGMMGDPGVRMPAFRDVLTEEDVRAILAYIKTWWTEEQRRTQADLSQRYQESLDRQKKGQ
jgi:mono/diheme cytochrome c family protein